MRISQCLIDNVVGAFGSEGEDWIKVLPNLLEKAIEKWSLTHYMVADKLSYNYICLGKSEKFGDVALKLCVPNKELCSEIETLRLYRGKQICNCYDYDEKLGALLLERIMPGYDLTNVSDNRTRIAIAANLIADLAIPVDEYKFIPSYDAWIKKAFSRAKTEGRVGDKMLGFVKRAELFFQEIELLNCPKVLLHGDLHHFNILRSENGEWKAIDPKGVIGVPFLDCARFIENQLDMTEEENKVKLLDEMITVFSERYCEAKGIIAKSIFLDSVLSTCWHYEENDCNKDKNEFVNRCQLLLDYIDNYYDNIACNR